MDRIAVNALQRARNSKGITQEKLAEMSGYSVDSIQAWERGTRTPSIQTLDLLAICLDAPWLPGMFLREQSAGEGLSDMIPNFTPGEPLSRSVMQLLNRIYDFADRHKDRRLMQIAEDDVISADERAEYDGIMADLAEIVKAAATLRYSAGGPKE